MEIVTLGDPVVDVLVWVDQDDLLAQSIEIGGCIPVEANEIDRLLREIRHSGEHRKAGGSAANVARGLANLGGNSVGFAGMVGDDQAGREYEAQLQAQGIRPMLCRSSTGAGTATCLCMVTPDGQRTMRTCLAAASELQAIGQLRRNFLSGCRLLHCEGYTMYRPELAKGAMAAARQAAALVSLDLASFELVKDSAVLLELLREGCVDLVFCNEEEAQALAEVVGVSTDAQEDTFHDVQRHLLQTCQVSVVSLGSKGCIARNRRGEVGSCRAPAVEVVDSIGAGDLFTAGFLHAYLEGASLQVCAESGCAVGSASVQSAGAEMSASQWERLRSRIGKFLSEAAAEPES